MHCHPPRSTMLLSAADEMAKRPLHITRQVVPLRRARDVGHSLHVHIIMFALVAACIIMFFRGFPDLLAIVPRYSSISTSSQCKATPGSYNWPTQSQWAALNHTISGRLLQSPPPGAVCHPGEPTYDPETCLDVQKGWLTDAFHASQPASRIDLSCLGVDLEVI